MNAFSGVVALDGEEVPVTVGLDNERVNLMSGDMEIGDWSNDECSITPSSDGKWLIEAESEALAFAPGRPDLFARAIAERTGEVEEETAEDEEPQTPADVEPEADHHEPPPISEDEAAEPEATPSKAQDTAESKDAAEFEVADGPPARSATMIGFYVLAGITAILAVWAVISIFFS